MPVTVGCGILCLYTTLRRARCFNTRDRFWPARFRTSSWVAALFQPPQAAVGHETVGEFIPYPG